MSAAGGRLEERALAQAADLARAAYDVKGLAFFKSKLDPVWVPRYGAIRHRRDLPAFAFAPLSLHLGGVRGMTRTAVSLVRRAPRERPAPTSAG